MGNSHRTQEAPEGIVYRVPGPGGDGHMWIARASSGQVAHGRTAESAIERLNAVIMALAVESGLSVAEWIDNEGSQGFRFVRKGELLQA